MARAQSAGARLGKQWDSIAATSQPITAVGTTLGASLAVTAAQTVLRMIGGFRLASTGVATAADNCRITVGIGVVSTDAFTAGSGSVPDPGGEPDYPWLYWKSTHLFYPAAVSATAGQGDQTGVGSATVLFDIRSMRKMKPRESLAWVIEYADISGTPPIQVMLDQVRVLIGLH